MAAAIKRLNISNEPIELTEDMVLKQVTWHTAHVRGLVWFRQFGKLQAGIIRARGPKKLQIERVDNGAVCARLYSEVFWRKEE